MKRQHRPSLKDFDQAFEEGKLSIDFKGGIVTEGLSKVIKLPPLTIPAWLGLEIENLSMIQANSKASVIRQLLVEAIQTRKKAA